MPLEWEHETKQQKKIENIDFPLYLPNKTLRIFTFYILRRTNPWWEISSFFDVEAYFRIKHFIPWRFPHRSTRDVVVAAAYAI